MKFNELNLDQGLLESITYMGFDECTPIQQMAIPEILKGKDLIACAQTGTGKTAAFLLPVINNMLIDHVPQLTTLILEPTRELALQVDQQIRGIAYFAGIESIALYGGGDGADWSKQINAVKQGTEIVVATPGRLIAMLNTGDIKCDNVKYLILDEADRMLDIGFLDDLMRIISFLPEQRQTLMFSATMPQTIRKLASKILQDPVELSTAISKPAEGVLQAAYLVHDDQKNQLINVLIKDKPEYSSILIFSSTKRKVKDIVNSLKKNGFDAEGISSDLEQKEREGVLLRFRSREIRVLVATDVLSRGIDIKDINLVINYDVPQDAEDYVHRVGRTARAETTGVALTLINQDDMYKFKRIEALIESEVFKIPLPEVLGEGPQWNVSGGRRNTRPGEPSKKKNFRKSKKKKKQ
jgi:superfamily II DNA/RNA helicase